MLEESRAMDLVCTITGTPARTARTPGFLPRFLNFALSRSCFFLPFPSASQGSSELNEMRRARGGISRAVQRSLFRQPSCAI